MTKRKFRNRYDAIQEERIATNTEGETLTNQSQYEETDLLIMAKKYGLKSILPRTEVTEQMYGFDLTSTMDYNERLEIRERMKEYFYHQPAIIRKEFDDNYNKFYEMYLTGDTQKMIDLGMLPKPQIKTDEITPIEPIKEKENV